MGETVDHTTEMVPYTRLREILGAREAALSTIDRALDLMRRGAELAREARDHASQAHRVLADYYGEVLPDGVPGHEETLRRRSTTIAVSTDLAFYPSPPAVVQAVVHRVYVREGDRVLEPSAGTGALVRAVLGRGAAVHAVEVDPERCDALRGIRAPDLTVQQANFLDVPAVAAFDVVLMNPPFHGRHWMAHVRHAYGFLAPGGRLVSVLPVTAELGDTPEHEAFRAWARTLGGARFTDLPPESFAASGTRINTVLLELRRPAHDTTGALQ